MRRVAFLLFAVTVASLFGAPPAAAHPMPHSVVQLTVDNDTVDAELQLPVEDLTLASGITPDSGSSWQPALRTYLSVHTGVVGVDGQAWRVEIGRMSLTDAQQTSTGEYRELIVAAVFTPPAGADVRRFTFAYDAIVHQVATHTVLVSGDAGEVGTIRTDRRSMTVAPLDVDLGGGSAWPGFASMVRLGGSHIAEGTDHLLFLLSLLLPAALLAAGGRWRGTVSARQALRRIGLITAAFTIGHSIALAVSAVSRIEFPARPVEAFIALSILISAIHAIRPLFPRRETLVAAVFGLGHGMAFAFTLAEMRLTTGQLVFALFGFNLGIELVQLALVLLALPALLALARSRVGAPMRIGAALLTAVAAVGWLADRLGWTNPIADAADSAGAHPAALAALLGGASAVVSIHLFLRTLRARQSEATATPENTTRVEV